MTDLTVSVILNVYNGAATLRESLESLLAQTYAARQIIVVDDGSTDSSVTIAQAIAAAYSQVQVIAQPNRGRAAARNEGLAHAVGDIVAFAEDDAFYTPTYLEKAVRHFADPQVGGVIGPHYVWNRNESLTTRFKEMERRRTFVNFRPTGCWLYRRTQLLEMGGFDEQLEMADDVVPGLQLLKQGARIVFEPEAIWLHREPASFWQYMRRKFRGGMSLGLLVKQGLVKPPLSARFMFSCMALLSIVTFGLWASPRVGWRVWAALALALLPALALVRLPDIRKTRQVSNEPIMMVLLGVMVEYLWWSATLMGVLYSLLTPTGYINRNLKGR